MRKILMALTVVGLSMSAMAQTADYPVVENSVQTNSFCDNWFLSLGGGVQTQVTSPSAESLTPNFTFALGRWFTPDLGLRLQTHFLQFHENAATHRGAAVYGQAMFDLTNMLGGYKQERLYSAIPYVGFGRMFGDVQRWSPWAVGYLSSFRLSPSWTFDLDLFLKSYDAASCHCQAGVALGLSWHIGGRGFDASVDMEAVYAMHAAQLASLNEALAAEQAVNRNLKEQLATKPHEVVKEKVIKEMLAAPLSLFFAFNSAKISSAKEILNLESLAHMARNSGAKLRVTGYADSATGVATYNQQLSVRRAQAVARELVKLGVAEENIVVEGKGGVAEVSPAAYNRRVVIEAL